MPRLLRIMPAIVLLTSTMLAAGPAQAAPDCETDVSLTMAASAVAGNQVQYQIDLLHDGPCRPSSLTVFDDLSLLSPGFTYAITASTPTSWSCTLGTTSFTCVLPGAKLGIDPDRYAALTVLVSWGDNEPAPASTTNKASVSTNYPDPNPINNTAHSAVVDGTSSLVTEPLTAGASQQQKIASPNGNAFGAQVQFGDTCEATFGSTSGCFGRLVRISAGDGGLIEPYFVLTFLYTADVTPAGSTLNQLGILHLYDGTAYSLASCPNRGPIPLWGCIAQKDRLSDVAFKTPANPKGYYYILTIFTQSNNDWAGDS